MCVYMCVSVCVCECVCVGGGRGGHRVELLGLMPWDWCIG